MATRLETRPVAPVQASDSDARADHQAQPKRPRVVIIGGGLAGMAAATLLAEQGYRVTLVERSSRLGGKACSSVSPEGCPTEHSLRIISDSYGTMLALMARIPNGTGGVLIDNLREVELRIGRGQATGAVPTPPPVDRGQSPWRTWWQRQFLLFTVLLRIVLLPIPFLFKFRRLGISCRESLFYLWQHVRFLGMCEARRRRELGRITYAEYLGFDKRSPAYREIFGRLPTIIVAARPDSSAYEITWMMAASMFAARRPPPGAPYVKRRMMLDGPSSDRLITPWAQYLEALGVQIQTEATVRDVTVREGAIVSIGLENGTELRADYYIAATSLAALVDLCDRTDLGQIVAAEKLRTTFRSEWSSGVQIFLAELPTETPAWLRPGVLTAHLESPWSFVSVVQADGFWRDVPFPTGIQAILSATWSDVHAPGIVTGKPMIECEPAEILQEALAQCGFERTDLVRGFQVDQSLLFLSAVDYQALRDRLPPHLAHAVGADRCLVNLAPLAIALPGAPLDGPETRTSAANLYLAGEFIRTDYAVPTMEKAIESGCRAALAIASDSDPEAYRAMEMPIGQQELFGTLRAIDAWLYGQADPAQNIARR